MALQYGVIKERVREQIVTRAPGLQRHGGRVIGGSFLSAGSLIIYLIGVLPLHSGLARSLFTLSLIAGFLSGFWTAVGQESREGETVPRLIAYVACVFLLLILTAIL